MSEQSQHPHEDEKDEDAGLVQQCRGGDVEAFGLLVARHEGRILALVGRLLGPTAPPGEVAAAARDVFVQAWRALPRFRGDGRFACWISRIAVTTASRQWGRRRRRREPVAENITPTAAPSWLAANSVRQAEGRALQAAVDGLPETLRTVVLLHYFEAYPCEEIAALLGCPVGTVWTRLHDGCRRLRAALPWLEE